MSQPTALTAGRRAPDFVLAGPAGSPARFYAHAGGRPTALLFAAADDVRTAELHAALAGREDVDLVVVSPGRVDAVPTWVDESGALRERYGVAPDETAAVILDPNLRVAGFVSGADLVEATAALLDSLRYAGPATVVTAQAPVLLVPGAVERALCDRLIEVWRGEGSIDTGVERSGAAESIDPAVKRRRDHTVTDQALVRELSATVGRAVMPEVQKAFAFRATRFEGFKIACYDASTGGFFRPHRDNLTPSTAHRVFALTINLSADYDGGELRFPEYGNQLYRPDAGAALVFSCAQLHEVRDVTRGQRFVLLSFLYGDPPEPAQPR